MGDQLELPNVDPPIERVKTAARKWSAQQVEEALGRRPYIISERWWCSLRDMLSGLLFGAFMLGFQVALRKADVNGITYEEE